MKVCSRKTCAHKGVPQPVSNFNKKTASRDGYYPACRACVKAYEKASGVDEYRRKFSKAWKQKDALYDVFAHQLSYCEEVQRDPDFDYSNLLMVRCSFCNDWFNPTNSQVHNRINTLNGKKYGEAKFYCSESCKKECDTYRRQTHLKSEAKSYSLMNRDATVQNEIREMVLERDGYICQKCGSKENLFCHHIEPLNVNPIESADIDMAIMLCSDCHEEIHSRVGCRRQDLQCKKTELVAQ